MEQRWHDDGVFAGDAKANHRAGALVNRDIQGLEPLDEIGPARVVLPLVLEGGQHGA